ncbi:MAG TPA: GntR family transcriptional regulator [Lapillicoccus sp.]|nr:GntR family transcriptional regulator [Lapillicoccus sp.]
MSDTEGSWSGTAPTAPKYLALAGTLRGAIAVGRWPLGARLPVERELAHQHQVALNTVRRAVALLCREGLLERRQGSGTYVLARPSERGAKPDVVGVLVPSTTYYYPRVLEGIERALSAQDVRMMLSCAAYDPAEELRQAERLVASGAQGLIVVPTLHTNPDPVAHLAALKAVGVPQVLVERIPPSPAPDDDTEYVATDHVAGAYAAVRHLRDLGHERVGYLGRSGTASSASVGAGFDAAVTARITSADNLLREESDSWPAESFDAFVRTCADRGVTAVLCLGDREGAGLEAAVHRAGRRVPGDLAVVAYDDEVADLAEVPLTAVRPPKEELGRLAAQLLLRRLRLGPSAARHQVRIKPAIIVRDSCGARLSTQSLSLLAV